ncbi:hypothetical protein NEUTE1DRAFT_98837 [Neurospora tetrasperma FGSC 2508]|uniref:Uncharacterized protein n=1 Tax=Neurospora tetrasperma (strain FGSC 2508 / ATCC MYA-4615 / P0657) TaxID=510951 RepID=F8MGA2_NEUT8|nr:uncharacterized protein NEUTE1DRAFT_98837 [Neurospora tetrasperma FGSC 2508]EGO58577.1 hypothetical protein NEUTE1DRAFT_98837 [Neurospora tetrasperma FGSC 2508]
MSRGEILKVQCLGGGPILKWKERDWRSATEGRYRSYTVCCVKSSKGLRCDEAESGLHRDRQIARSVARRPSTKGIDGTKNGASTTLSILSHGRPPTVTVEGSNLGTTRSVHQISKMELNLSFDFPTPGSSSQEDSFDDEVDDDMLEFIDDEFDQAPENLELFPGFNQGVNQPGEFYHPGSNQPNLHHPAAISEAGIPAVDHPDLPAANGYAHEGKTVEDMMDEDNDGVYQGYITSHEHAAQLEAEYQFITVAKVASSIKPESLLDIPRTEEARANWRERIFYAITDFDNVVNKDRKKVVKDKEGNRVDKGTVVNTHVRRVRNLCGFENELMADKILNWAVEAHQGRVGIPPWCEKRSWNLEQFPTFNARMEAILEALRTNKSVPHSYVQVDPTRRFVAAPMREVRVKQDNMDGNEKKGGLIDEGWQARQKEPQGN